MGRVEADERTSRELVSPGGFVLICKNAGDMIPTFKQLEPLEVMPQMAYSSPRVCRLRAALCAVVM